jgi:hypothetical protein
MPDMFAFWSDDQYPYMLGGTVVKSNDDGTVETKEYGCGMRFKPSFTVNINRGKDLKEKLDILRAERRDAINRANGEFGRRLEAFLKNERLPL